MNTADTASYVRSDVRAQLFDWQLINDCCAGDTAIKARTTDYLPTPDSAERTTEVAARYTAYLQRAVFYNVTKRTRAGLVGLAFSEPPTIQLPSQLTVMEQNVDGAGVSLQQQMQDALTSVISHGRFGLYVDYPRTSGALSAADLATRKLRPIIRTYMPWDIINWRTVAIGATTVPSLIVLRESCVANQGEFVDEYATQYRVLRLVSNNEYTVTLYREDASRNMGAVSDPVVVRGAQGNAFGAIPFVCIGSINNDLSIDEAPMLDLAKLNIAHFRNSADYEESVFMCGQDTPVLTGMTDTWWKNTLNKKVRLGSRSAVPLPVGADLKLIRSGPNSMVREAMQDKERQMVALGARLIQTQSVQRTATEARIESASEMSVLNMCANNVAAGYAQALAHASQFAGGDATSTIEMHANAELERLSPEEQTVLISLLQAGIASKQEIRDILRKGGVQLSDRALDNELDLVLKAQDTDPAMAKATEQLKGTE